MTWKQRGARIISVFFTGYGAGFGVVIPADYIHSPGTIDWIHLFILPIISGLIVTFPQIGKVFGDMANEN